MKKSIKTKTVFLMTFFLAASALIAHAFRCGDEIITVGDSRAKVIIKCGPPTYKEKAAAKKDAPPQSGKRSQATDDRSAGKKRSAAKGVEKWAYNCGKDDFIYVLTFEGGLVAKIDTDGRGRGASECLGK